MNLDKINEPYREPILVIARNHPSHTTASHEARAVLDVLIAQDQAKLARALTRATWALAGMTFVLALATLALVVV